VSEWNCPSVVKTQPCRSAIVGVTPTVAEGRALATVGLHYRAPGDGNAISQATKRHHERGPDTIDAIRQS
jgi:hypothetical protein